MMDDFYSQPIKKQRVFIRDRVPADVVTAVIEANRDAPKDQLPPASIEIFFIWTDYGIKLRWQIWRRPPSEIQYYSHQGDDEIVPAGITMIASYSNTIKNDKYIVSSADVDPRRYPASANGTFFPGSPGLAYTNRPISGGEYFAVFESDPQLPEWIELRWALFPLLQFRPIQENPTQRITGALSHSIAHSREKTNAFSSAAASHKRCATESLPQHAMPNLIKYPAALSIFISCGPIMASSCIGGSSAVGPTERLLASGRAETRFRRPHDDGILTILNLFGSTDLSKGHLQ